MAFENRTKCGFWMVSTDHSNVWFSDPHLTVQRGSEICPFEIRHLKYGLFEGQISIIPVFEWSGFIYGYSFSSNKSKTGLFGQNFQWFLEKLRPCVLSPFQMVGFPNFRSHLKSGKFATQPLFNHS